MDSHIAGRPGRPRKDVSELIHAFFSVLLKDGAAVSDVASEGLKIYVNAKDPKPVRKLKDKHLEAAFRASEHERVVPWLRPTKQFTHSWPTFMGRPLPVPIGAAMPSERKPGRRKKVRARSL